MDYALPPEQAYVIWCLSWLGPFVGLFGLLRGYMLLGFLHLMAGCFAMSYWSAPLLTSWRRYIDIAWIQLTLWTFVWNARSAQYRIPFYVLVTLGAMVYPIGWVTDNPWMSTLAHGCVHILGEAASFVLFLGSI